MGGRSYARKIYSSAKMIINDDNRINPILSKEIRGMSHSKSDHILCRNTIIFKYIGKLKNQNCLYVQ